MTTRPNQFLIFPDPSFTADTIVSATSEEGRTVGTWTPDVDNEGDLQPFADGDPTADTEITAQIVQSGTIASALWGWKLSGDSGVLFGQDDFRYLHHGHNPYAGDDYRGEGLAVAYSARYRRLLFFRRSPDATPSIDIRYIDEPDMDAVVQPEWDNAVFAPERYGTTTYLSSVVVLDLPDGSMRAFVQWKIQTSVYDVDMYGSQDGGLTWTLLTKGILTKFSLTRAEFQDMRGAVSGDWIRIALVSTSDYTIRTIISSDRGATWNEQTISTAIGSSSDGWTGHARPYDIVALDDSSGRFLLAQKTSTLDLTWWYATGGEEWIEQSDLGLVLLVPNPTPANVAITEIALVRDDSRVYAFGYVHHTSSNSGVNAWTETSAPIEDVLDVDAWSPMQGSGASDINPYAFPAARGTVRFRPGNVHACAAGDRLVFFSGIKDNEDSGNVEEYTTTWQVYGWSRRAFSYNRGSEGVGASAEALMEYEWMSAMGQPAGSATLSSSGTRLIRHATGTVSDDWTPDRHIIHADGSGDRLAYSWLAGAAPTYYWGDQSCLLWTNRVPYAGSAANTEVYVRGRYLSATPGITVDVSVRWRVTSQTTQQAVLWDEVANTALETLSNLQVLATYAEWRLAVERETTTAVRCQLMYRTLGAVTWTATSVQSLATLGSHANQEVQWGCGNGGSAGSTAFWKDFRICGQTHLGQLRYDVDSTLAGKPTSSRPAYLVDGISARWGGGGGFAGDVFEYENLYQLGVQNLFLPSPSMPYRTTSGSCNQIVFDAGAAGRWVHDAIGMFGCQARRVIVEYSNASDFSTLVATETLDFAVTSSATTFATLNGNYATMQGALPNNYAVGHLGNHLLWQSAGTSAFKVGRHLRGGSVVAENVQSTLQGAGFTTNAAIVALSPDAVKLYSARRVARYMRWTMDVGLSGPNISTLHQIGAVVVGTTCPISVPMDWVHDDTEVGNVSMNEGTAGQRWSRREGPGRRTLEGRINGDVNLYREELRNMVRDLAEFSNKPVVLALDDRELTLRDRILYCRITSDMKLEQQGWYQDTNDRSQRLGDLALIADEEV